MQTKHDQLTDDQWEVIKGYLNWQRKRQLSLRKVFEAILWITRTGSQWRNLESKYPAWQAVYYYFYKWSRNGMLKELNFALNSWERIQRSRAECPSLGIVDSQSIKLAPTIYEYRGTDGNKKINGRKRQLLVDVLGRIWKVAVHPANIHDSKGGQLLLEDLKKEQPRLKKIVGDKAYRGSFAKALEKLAITFEVPHRLEGQKGFVVEKKRWIVERTIAWFNFFRRIVIDYEHTTSSADAFLLLANISMACHRIDFSKI